MANKTVDTPNLKNYSDLLSDIDQLFMIQVQLLKLTLTGEKSFEYKDLDSTNGGFIPRFKCKIKSDMCPSLSITKEKSSLDDGDIELSRCQTVIPLNCGNACMFSAPPRFFVKFFIDCPFSLCLREKFEGRKGKCLGRGFVQIEQLIEQVLMVPLANEVHLLPFGNNATYTIRLRDSDGILEIGELEVEILFSCLGKIIITDFRFQAEAETYVFCGETFDGKYALSQVNAPEEVQASEGDSAAEKSPPNLPKTICFSPPPKSACVCGQKSKTKCNCSKKGKSRKDPRTKSTVKCNCNERKANCGCP